MNTLAINGQDITIKEYQGQRGVTFKEIDQVHGRYDGTARKRFNDNRRHFVEKIDFFKITASEFRTLFGGLDARHQTDITLLTETGYLMLVKSFMDELMGAIIREKF